jgi:hypothetical protein
MDMGTDTAVSAVEHASTSRPGSSSSEGALLWFREEHLPPAPTAPSYARNAGRADRDPRPARDRTRGQAIVRLPAGLAIGTAATRSPAPVDPDARLVANAIAR